MSAPEVHQSVPRRQRVRLVLALAFLVLLLIVVLSPAAWQTVPSVDESLRAISETLFGFQLLAFELLSVLLLAALIGAIFLARRPL